MTSVRVFEGRAALMRATALRIANAIEISISERGEASVALSGGGTPEPAYELLAAMPLDWPRVTFLLVDERFVPPSHAASNEGMLRRSLASAFNAGAQLLPMFSSGGLRDAAARADEIYSGQSIDIALMGMGDDGHTASWFPQSPDLNDALNSARSVVAITAPNAAGSPERLTLTRTALTQSKAIVLLITGAQKRALIEDQTRARLPVDQLFALPFSPDIYWAP